tara:strand:+ start:7007 stop:7894 length:888 start_codon:yes stop_codon:yes gene_type:complete
MVELREEKRGTKTYFYLEHSVRDGGSVFKKRQYLGDTIPKDIEEAKRQFFHKIFKERWLPNLEEIQKNYTKHKKTLPPSAKDKAIENFVIKFTYDTQRIEGSTLSLRDTANLLQKGLTPKAKSIDDVKEAESHKKVFYHMLKERNLSFQAVLRWHHNLLTDTKPDIVGKIRSHQVAIGGSKFLPPSPVEVDFMLRNFFDWYKENKGKTHPVELAALVHLKFVTIHPFTDGNGRISRLMMNFVLNEGKCPLFSIPYTGRDSYYTALERAQLKKQEYIFVQWFVKKYIKEIKKWLSS